MRNPEREMVKDLLAYIEDEVREHGGTGTICLGPKCGKTLPCPVVRRLEDARHLLSVAMDLIADRPRRY